VRASASASSFDAHWSSFEVEEIKMITAIDTWLLDHVGSVMALGSVVFFLFHYYRQADAILLAFFGVIVVALGTIFVLMWVHPEPIPLSHLFGILISYGILLFIVLSESLLRGGAKWLTKVRGEKWLKEMDYVYLIVGVAGIFMSMNKIEILTGRIEGTDILASVTLMTAIVVRFIKTRADIGGWNTLGFNRSPDTPTPNS
jgi:hypothetical protein